MFKVTQRAERHQKEQDSRRKKEKILCCSAQVAVTNICYEETALRQVSMEDRGEFSAQRTEHQYLCDCMMGVALLLLSRKESKHTRTHWQNSMLF